MNLLLAAATATVATMAVAAQVGDAVDSALCRAPWYRVPRDIVLDTIFGRAESFEYTGTTTPSAAP